MIAQDYDTMSVKREDLKAKVLVDENLDWKYCSQDTKIDLKSNTKYWYGVRRWIWVY